MKHSKASDVNVIVYNLQKEATNYKLLQIVAGIQIAEDKDVDTVLTGFAKQQESCEGKGFVVSEACLV